MPDWGHGGPFLGRLQELAWLRSAAVTQRPRAVVVSGDVGVGKSRLLSVAAEEAEADGALVLRGACLNIGDAWPYHPVREALHRRAGSPGAGDADARRLVEVLDDEAVGVGGGRVLERLHQGLVELAAGRPLVL